MSKQKHQPDHVLAKNEASTFIPHEAGQFAALCVDVIDLGDKVEQYEGKPQKLSQKAALVFRTNHKNPETGDIIDVVKEFTVSMYETANLRKFLEAWRNKAFTDDEVEAGAPLHKLCGVAALIQVENKKSGGGRYYANINAVQKLPPVMQPGCPDGEGYERPEYLTTRKAEYAKGAEAYRAQIGASIKGAKSALQGEEEGPADDDDLPF